jgi:hypothetical protein
MEEEWGDGDDEQNGDGNGLGNGDGWADGDGNGDGEGWGDGELMQSRTLGFGMADGEREET